MSGAVLLVGDGVLRFANAAAGGVIGDTTLGFVERGVSEVIENDISNCYSLTSDFPRPH